MTKAKTPTKDIPILQDAETQEQGQEKNPLEADLNAQTFRADFLAWKLAKYAALLEEAKAAFAAITIPQAGLHNVQLTFPARVDEALKLDSEDYTLAQEPF